MAIKESELPPPSPELKLSWEIRKMQFETAAYHRPFRNPSVVVTLSTTSIIALISLTGLLMQWWRSANEYTLAQIRTERLDLDSAQLEKRREALDAEVASRSAQLQQITEQLTEMEMTLSRKSLSNAQLEDAQAQLRDTVTQLRAASGPAISHSTGLTGFIFLGDYDAKSGSWTRYCVYEDSSKKPLANAPTSLAAGHRFTLRYYMVLRQSLPPNTAAYYRTIPEVATLPAGTVVSLRASPVERVRGAKSQYWVEVIAH